ncbi:MAG TPA: hypothetical protein VHP32_06670 [Ignavibacteria bacterium]|nr:hypothetical protein [Ignavibacteria bacterium]
MKTIITIGSSSELPKLLSNIERAAKDPNDKEILIFGCEKLSYNDVEELSNRIKHTLPNAKIKAVSNLNLKGMLILCSAKKENRNIEPGQAVSIDPAVLNDPEVLELLERVLCKQSASKLNDESLRNLLFGNTKLDAKLLKKHGLCTSFQGEKVNRKKTSSKAPSLGAASSKAAKDKKTDADQSGASTDKPVKKEKETVTMVVSETVAEGSKDEKGNNLQSNTQTDLKVGKENKKLLSSL